MRYLITGGCGFIGAYVTRYLIREGHEVVIYDFNPNTTLLFHLLNGEQQTKVTVVAGDTTDLAGFIRTVRKYDIQEIVHLAYMLTSGSEINPSLAIRINIQGTSNVFEAAAILGLRKVVWASSITVFGSQADYAEKCLGNDAVHKPRYLYGACKSFCEYLGKYYFAKHELDNVGLRFALVYGPGRYSTMTRGTVAGFASELIEKPVLSTDPCKIPYGDDVISWLYVEDAARSVYLGSQANRTAERAYTICGDLRPMKEAVSYVQKLLPKAKIEVQPGKLDLFWNHELDPAEKGIGYRPQYSMERGVEETIKMVQAGL